MAALRRGWSVSRPHVVPLLGYAFLTAAFFWPVLRHLRTQALSNGGDGSSSLWAFWQVPDAVGHLHNPFMTKALFHPVGADLTAVTTVPLISLLAWPVTAVLGLVAAVNLMQLGTTFAAAIGAYFLALRVCGSRVASFVAGFAFAFVPYRFIESGSHINLVQVAFLPFGLLALLRFLDRPTRGRAVVVGGLVGAALLTDANITALLVTGLVVVALAHERRDRAALRPRQLLPMVLAALVVASPVLVAGVRALFHESVHVPRLGGAEHYSADLLSWVLPLPSHPLWGSQAADLGRRLYTEGQGIAYPGLLVLALAIVGAVRGGRQARPWVILAAVAGVLSLGPFLFVNGHTVPMITFRGVTGGPPLPYLLLLAMPVLDNLRDPDRFAILAILALDVLGALALAQLRDGARRLLRVVPYLALAVLVVEFLPGPLPLTSGRIPAPYRAIARDHSAGAVLDLPIQWRTGFTVLGDSHPYRDDTIFMYYATAHGRPIVGGSAARLADWRLTRLLSIPLYREILVAEGERFPRRQDPPDPPRFSTADLRALGFAFVVYHRDRPMPTLAAHLVALNMPVLADDGVVVAWRVPPQRSG